MNRRRRPEYWIEEPARALLLFLFVTLFIAAAWLAASILSHSTRAEFIDQAQLGLDAIALVITALALVAASHEIWRGMTPARLLVQARFESAEAVTTAARNRMFITTVPRGDVEIDLANAGPGECILQEVRLRWWVDLVREDRRVVLVLEQPVVELVYVADVDLGGIPLAHWVEGDEVNTLRIDRSIVVQEKDVRKLPYLRLECRDPDGYFGYAGSEAAHLRLQLECISQRKEYLSEFVFSLPRVSRTPRQTP